MMTLPPSRCHSLGLTRFRTELEHHRLRVVDAEGPWRLDPVDRSGTAESYIYRVLKPERATPSIVKGDDGNWEINQLLLSLNRPVGAKTRETVRMWLEQYAVSA